MSKTSIIALAVFIAAAILVLMMRTHSAQKLQKGALQLVRPLHSTTSGVGSRLGAAVKGLKSLDQLEDENHILTVENQKLRATNQMLNKLQSDNNNLRQALGYQQQSSFNLLPARVIVRKASAWWSSVQIDRGEQDGLDSDMPVVTDTGLVGKTTTVARSTAVVVLISDENCQVYAKVEGTREQGILSGERTSPNAQPELSLKYLSKDAQLQPGQKVFSNGVSGGVFPGDLLLGTIKTVSDRPLDKLAAVEPAVDLSKLENVFIVLGNRSSGPAADKEAGGKNDKKR